MFTCKFFLILGIISMLVGYVIYDVFMNQETNSANGFPTAMIAIIFGLIPMFLGSCSIIVGTVLLLIM